MYKLKKVTNIYSSQIKKHFLRLDHESRYSRFCFAIQDEGLIQYVDKMNYEKNGIFAIFDMNDYVIGIGECILNDNNEAEVAFSVDKMHRGKGLGSRLMNRIVEFAHKKQAKNLQMFCLNHNQKTRYMAKKYGFSLNTTYGQSHAMIAFPTEISFHSMLDDHYDNINEQGKIAETI